MHRFYADETRRGEGAAFLTPEDARHALRVLRMEVGDQAEIYLGGKRYSAEISLIDDQDVRLSLQTELPSTEAKLRITLYQGLPKADKMELIVQKATELGAAQVVPELRRRGVQFRRRVPVEPEQMQFLQSREQIRRGGTHPGADLQDRRYGL